MGFNQGERQALREAQDTGSKAAERDQVGVCGFLLLSPGFERLDVGCAGRAADRDAAGDLACRAALTQEKQIAIGFRGWDFGALSTSGEKVGDFGGQFRV